MKSFLLFTAFAATTALASISHADGQASRCYDLLPLYMTEIAGVKLAVKEVPGKICVQNTDGRTGKVEFKSFNTNQTVALFDASISSGACRQNRDMAECTYVTLGRGKVLNTIVQSNSPLRLLIKLTSIKLASRPGLYLGKGHITLETDAERGSSPIHPFTFLRMN